MQIKKNKYKSYKTVSRHDKRIKLIPRYDQNRVFKSRQIIAYEP